MILFASTEKSSKLPCPEAISITGYFRLNLLVFMFASDETHLNDSGRPEKFELDFFVVIVRLNFLSEWAGGDCVRMV